MYIYTTISKNYVSDWGVNQGVRELIQNALDSQDNGNKMGVTYHRTTKRLMVYNQKVVLDRNSLLLGSTSKSGSSQRGKYGEGYKIGSLALVRAGKKVNIYTGKEHWQCLIKPNPDFEDSEVLTFKIGKNKILDYPLDKLLFEVEGITPDEWKSMNTLFLSIYSPKPETLLKALDGTVLLDKEFKGRIYCGGIYVDTDKELTYGYDFNPSSLSLNRDRNMVNSFDVRWNTSKIWAFITANKVGKLFDVKKMLKEGVPDVEYLKEFSDYTVKGKIAEDFFKENSERSYPVTSESEAQTVRSYGYNPVYASSSYSGMLRTNLGSIEELQRRVELEYTIFQDITPVDDANIQYSFEVMFKLVPKFKFDLKIVKFVIDTTRSISDKTTLTLNSSLLKNKYDVLQECIRHYCLLEKKSESNMWKKLFQQTQEGIKDE